MRSPKETHADTFRRHIRWLAFHQRSAELLENVQKKILTECSFPCTAADGRSGEQQVEKIHHRTTEEPTRSRSLKWLQSQLKQCKRESENMAETGCFCWLKMTLTESGFPFMIIMVLALLQLLKKSNKAVSQIQIILLYYLWQDN